MSRSTLEQVDCAPAATVSGEPDLWCTYAALRTLRWLGHAPGQTASLCDVDGTAKYLAARRNADGGYAWSRGMPSDAWATFYSTQALRDLSRPVAERARTTRWLQETWSGDAYGMTPGQAPDAWAVHFSTRTTVEICGVDVPDRARLLSWLAALQTPDGGLTWSPEHTIPDVRACYYGLAAWRALATLTPVHVPWDVTRLVEWLRGQQGPDGGFRFATQDATSCLWATYRAAAALNLLRERPLRDTASFVDARRGSAGGYRRWPGFQAEDVWATFSAVGTLQAIGRSTVDIAEVVATRLGEFACKGGGFTYREPRSAGDALTGAAAVMTGVASPGQVVPWLEGCQLPNEGGVMYMPGRGSEVRCTAWALAAGAFAADATARARIADWLHATQNPDGGFGFWQGRGSDLVSTSAALAVVGFLARPLPSVLDTTRLAAFVASCAVGDGYANVPGGTATLRAGAQALRVRAALGHRDDALLAQLLGRHEVRSGGFANEGSRMPDLLSTYEAVLAADVHGLPIDALKVGAFVARVHGPAGTAWTPLAPPGGGPLADALATLLQRRLVDQHYDLPPLTLS